MLKLHGIRHKCGGIQFQLLLSHVHHGLGAKVAVLIVLGQMHIIKYKTNFFFFIALQSFFFFMVQIQCRTT